ncbi:MAG: flippase [Chloroflexi bacterium]|nr:flippase [Chloroflexota bacterium]
MAWREIFRKALGGIAWNTAVQCVDRIVGMASGLLMAYYLSRYLGVEGYGKYGTVLAFVPLFRIVAEWGLDTVATREIAQRRDRANHYVGTLLVLKGFLCLAAVGLCWLVLAVMYYPVDTAAAIRIYSMVLLFVALESIDVIFYVDQRINFAMVAGIAGTLANLLLLFVVIARDLGLTGIVTSALIAMGVRYALVVLFSRRLVRPALGVDLALWRALAREAWPIGASGVCVALYNGATVLLLSKLADERAVGIYIAGARIPAALGFIPIAVINTVFPLFSRYAVSDPGMLARIYARVTDLIILAALPLAVGLTLLAPRVIGFLYGQRFGEASAVLQVMMWQAAAAFVAMVGAFLMVALGEQKTNLAIAVLSTALLVGGNVLVIPRWSYLGAVWVGLGTQVATLLCITAFLKWRANLVPSLVAVGKAGVAAAAAGLVVHLAGDASPIWGVLGGALLYAGLMPLMGAIRVADLRLLLWRAEG